MVDLIIFDRTETFRYRRATLAFFVSYLRVKVLNKLRIVKDFAYIFDVVFLDCDVIFEDFDRKHLKSKVLRVFY